MIQRLGSAAMLTKLVTASVIVMALVFWMPATAQDNSCADLTSNPALAKTASSTDKSTFLKLLNERVSANDLCAKNLLGRLYYTGQILGQDHKKAQLIFGDVSEQGFPPGLYNLAYVESKNPDAEQLILISLIGGIMIKYLGDDSWGSVSAKARELGFDYCTTTVVSSNSVEVKSACTEFMKNARLGAIHLAEKVNATSESYRSAGGTIMAVISLGMAVSAISSIPPAPPTTIWLQSTTLSPNSTLYLIPLR